MFFHQKRRPRRRAAVTVELAIVAPVLAAFVVGATELGLMYDTQNMLATAVREGARFAALDRSELVSSGQTTNQKIVSDVSKYLEALGIDTEDLSVHIVDPVDHSTPMDLDDPVNDLKLFELRLEIPWAAFSNVGGTTGSEFGIEARIVFRNARTSGTQ